MEGTYPIIIHGEKCGELSVTKEGSYTRFHAKCPLRAEVIRLCIYGEGREGYLGVPLPGGDMLILDKRFSPSSMKLFPGKIEGCTLAGESPVKTLAQMPQEVPAAQAEEVEEQEAAKEEKPTLWYATTDGALVSKDGEVEMVALPPEDERVPRDFPGQPRVIEGKEYLVYITKEMSGSND